MHKIVCCPDLVHIIIRPLYLNLIAHIIILKIAGGRSSNTCAYMASDDVPELELDVALVEDDGLDIVAEAANDLSSPGSGEAVAAVVACGQAVDRRGTHRGPVVSPPMSLHTVLSLSPAWWRLFILLVVMTISMLISASGLSKCRGGDELVEHDLMHSGLTSGRVVAFVG